VTDRAKPRMEDYEMIYDNGVAQYLKCNHCGERVERGIVTVSGHWVNCQKRIENDKHPSEITVISSGHKTTIPNKINMSELTQIKPITANEAELKQLAEVQQKLELEENVPPLTFKEIGQEMVKILDESRTAEPVIVTTVNDDSQVEVTRPNGNHTVNDGISNVEKSIVFNDVLPDAKTVEDIIKIYRQTGQLINPNTRVPINYSTMGYDFHIPVTIPQQYQDKIKSAIESVLGEMPLL